MMLSLILLLNPYFLMGGVEASRQVSEESSSKQFAKAAPVPIFYGLNESHGTSWVQLASNGIIGISYFQPSGSDSELREGSLVYQVIHPDGEERTEVVTTGVNMEISILLYDADSDPHIFVASSDSVDQVVDHYFKNEADLWEKELLVHFENEGGTHIYEMSAEVDRNGFFHMLILKTRSNPDSYDYYYAFRDAHLYYLNNLKGNWERELIHRYDMFYTIDEYSKMMGRQDIAIDSLGGVHVVFGEQVNGASNSSPCHLKYANNQTGSWMIETAVPYEPGTGDSAGWYPSLALDKKEQPHISCAYIARVPTGSARYSKLIYASRTDGNWVNQIVAEYDDGYHGRDGRDYTGGLTHLVFDRSDNPHIAFTDIASSHGPSNYFNLGNIRYAALKDGSWDISTIYRQPLPNSFYDATEMYGLCLLIPKNTNSIHMIGQEIEVYNEHEYHVELTHHVIKGEHSSEEPDFSNMMISYLPHFSMVENAWSTQLSLANPYDEPQDVLVAAYNEMGALNTYTTLQIPGKGGRSEPIDRLMPELNISRGWLKIGTQTNPVSGVMTFTYLPSGGTSSLPITNLTGTGLVLPLLENNHEWSSGFAVTNTSDEDATLLISCFDLDGTLIQTHTANVTRHGKFISMVQDIADSELPERVIMTIESSVPITGFALSFSIGNTMIIAVPAFIY